MFFAWKKNERPTKTLTRSVRKCNIGLLNFVSSQTNTHLCMGSRFLPGLWDWVFKVFNVQFFIADRVGQLCFGIKHDTGSQRSHQDGKVCCFSLCGCFLQWNLKSKALSCQLFSRSRKTQSFDWWSASEWHFYLLSVPIFVSEPSYALFLVPLLSRTAA